MTDEEIFNRLIAAWNNVQPTGYKTANDWGREAWNRVYDEALRIRAEGGRGIRVDVDPAPELAKAGLDAL